MRPTLATVLSPRPWESRLVDAALESGLVRLVGRCYNPADVAHVDVVVVGTETPWLNANRIARWRLQGIAVIGVFPAGDRVAVDLLCRSDVDQLFVENAAALLILRAARDLAGREAFSSLPKVAP